MHYVEDLFQICNHCNFLCWIDGFIFFYFLSFIFLQKKSGQSLILSNNIFNLWYILMRAQIPNTDHENCKYSYATVMRFSWSCQLPFTFHKQEKKIWKLHFCSFIKFRSGKKSICLKNVIYLYVYCLGMFKHFTTFTRQCVHAQS